MEAEEILERYRKGSADVRMSLFLSYRDLRDAFDCIEQSEPADLFAMERSVVPAGPQRTFFPLFRKWFREALCAHRDRAGT